MKKYFWIFLTMLLFLCFLSASAEISSPVAGRYGVIERGNLSGLTPHALLEELDVVSCKIDSGLYLPTGGKVSWNIVPTGGDGNYSLDWSLWYWPDSSDWGSRKEIATGEGKPKNVSIAKSGNYILVVLIIDDAQNYITWQSKPFYAASDADLSDENTVPGKVEALVKQCKQEVGTDETAIALWMHDYLTETADYDNSYKEYFPDGILLKHSGVCMGYASAYELLLNRAGIDCRFVSGYDSSQDGKAEDEILYHAWNAVEIEGDWYHVDCTWDDLGTYGTDYSYFLIPDSIMGIDHRWKYTHDDIPDTETGDMAYYLQLGYTKVETYKEATDIIDKAVANQEPYVLLMDTNGDVDFANVFTYLQDLYGKGTIYAYLSSGYADTNSMRLLPICILYSAENEAKFANPEPASISLYNIPDILYIGESANAHLKVSPDHVVQITDSAASFVQLQASDVDVTWSSSDPSVATVNDGVIYAVSKGKCTITAQCAFCSDSFEVHVLTGSKDTITLPESLKVLENAALENCANALSIELPTGLESICADAFAGCAKLEIVIFNGSNTVIDEDAFRGIEDSVLFRCPSDSTAHTFALQHSIDFILTD